MELESNINSYYSILDNIIHYNEDGCLSTTVYRKLTDKYLSLESHHPLKHKKAVATTLFHRAKKICSFPSRQNQRGRTRHSSFKTKWISIAMIGKISKQVSSFTARDSDMEV